MINVQIFSGFYCQISARANVNRIKIVSVATEVLKGKAKIPDVDTVQFNVRILLGYYVG